MEISSLSSLFDSIQIDSKDSKDGAYRQGDDIIIVSHSIRLVRGTLFFTFLDGNPPIFHNFSLQNSEEDDQGKSYFLFDGITPFSLSLLEAYYVQTLFDSEEKIIEFFPSIYYSHNRDDFFFLNVDGTTTLISHIPFHIHYIQNFNDSHSFDYVILYSPEDSDAWCEPITHHQALVLARIFFIHISELSTFVRD